MHLRSLNLKLVFITFFISHTFSISRTIFFLFNIFFLRCVQTLLIHFFFTFFISHTFFISRTIFFLFNIFFFALFSGTAYPLLLVHFTDWLCGNMTPFNIGFFLRCFQTLPIHFFLSILLIACCGNMASFNMFFLRCFQTLLIHFFLSILLIACCGNMTPHAIDYGKAYKDVYKEYKPNVLALLIGLVSRIQLLHGSVVSRNFAPSALVLTFRNLSTFFYIFIYLDLVDVLSVIYLLNVINRQRQFILKEQWHEECFPF